MGEKEAKRCLRKMLRSFTPESVLHLLAEIYGKSAEKAKRARNGHAYRQCKLVEGSLLVVGLGVDAAHPS